MHILQCIFKMVGFAWILNTGYFSWPDMDVITRSISHTLNELAYPQWTCYCFSNVVLFDTLNTNIVSFIFSFLLLTSSSSFSSLNAELNHVLMIVFPNPDSKCPDSYWFPRYENYKTKSTWIVMWMMKFHLHSFLKSWANKMLFFKIQKQLLRGVLKIGVWNFQLKSLKNLHEEVNFLVKFSK